MGLRLLSAQHNKPKKTITEASEWLMVQKYVIRGRRVESIRLYSIYVTIGDARPGPLWVWRMTATSPGRGKKKCCARHKNLFSEIRKYNNNNPAACLKLNS